MAKYIPLKKPSHHEQVAIDHLLAHLPDDYRLAGPARDVNGRELDGIVLAPTGILVLEYKHWEGRQTPRMYGAWGNSRSTTSSDNPFDQADTGAKRFGTLIKTWFDSGKSPCFVDYLIILTDPESSLDLSDVDQKQAQRVCLLADAPALIEQRLGTKAKFSEKDIEAIARALASPRPGKIILEGIKPVLPKAPMVVKSTFELKPELRPSLRRRFASMVQSIERERGL